MKACFLFIAFLLVCVFSPIQAEEQSLSNQVYKASGCGLSYIHKFAKVTNRFPSPPGTGLPAVFRIRELPESCFIIERAFLWWTISGANTEATVRVSMPDGGNTVVPAVKLGTGPDKCWQDYILNTVAYRADVTHLITGNGTYAFTPSTPKDSTDGISLFVIYRNTADNSYTGTLVLNDGLIIGVNNSNPEPLAFTQTLGGFQACEDSKNATGFIIASDLQSGLDSRHTFTLNGISQEFPQNFWNVDALPTSVTRSQTQAHFGITVYNDCFAWIVMGLYYRTEKCTNCLLPEQSWLNVQVTPTPVTICEGDSVVLRATSNGTARYSWTSDPPGLYATGASVVVRPDETTLYKVTGTDTNGCARGDASAYVIVRPKARISIHAATTAVCRGNNLLLTASGAGSYRWLPHPTLSTTAGASVVVTPVTTTTYTVEEATTSSCRGRQSITVTVRDGIQIADSPPLSICDGESIRLQPAVEGGTPPLTFLWWPNQDLDDPTAESPVVSPDRSRTYFVHVTDALGCTAESSIEVLVGNNLRPVITATGPTAFCAGDSVVLHAGEGYNEYQWSTGETTSTITVRQAGSYTVYVRAGDCAGTSEPVSVEIFPPPSVDAGPDLTACPGVGVQLSATGSGSFEWFPSDGLSAADVAGPFALPDSTTTYIVRVTSDAGCSATDTIVVTVPATVSASGPAGEKNVTVCGGDSLRLQSADAELIEWIEGENISDPNSASPVVRPTRTGRYIVRGINNSCASYDTVYVEVMLPPVVNITASTLVVCAGESLPLTATGAESYRWLAAPGLGSNNQAETVVTPTASTWYRVVGYSPIGCPDTASVYVQIRYERHLTIGADDYTVQPGDTLTIPLHATVQNFNILEGAALHTTTRFPADVLHLLSVSNPDASVSRVGNEYIVQMAFPALDVPGRADLFSMSCLALLSPTTIATISTEVTAATGGCMTVTGTDAKVRVQSCLPHGLQLFVRGSVAVTPLPAGETLDITLQNMSGPVQLTLYNMFGRVTGERVIAHAGDEEHVFFDIRDYSTGTYLLVVQNAAETITTVIPVVQ